MVKQDKGQKFQQAFKRARKEYEQLLEQREALDVRLVQLQRVMVTMSPLVGEDPPEAHLGLTDTIRQLLRTANAELRPPDIVARLKALGVKMQERSALPSVHTTLRRLIDNDEVELSRDLNGKKRYRWIG